MQTRKLILFVLSLLLLFPAGAKAQTQVTRKLKPRLPRLGAIKNYEATGMQTGCGNLYFTLPNEGDAHPARYIYLARPGGKDGWFNLDGRDTELKLLKTEITKYGVVDEERRYFYRAGATRITVTIRDTAPENPDYLFAAVITLRRGRASRRIKIIGSSDC